MNNKVFKAKLRWIPKENGGRIGDIPYHNKKYGPIISVNGERVIGGGEWSLLCCPYEKIDGEYTLAYIRYLNTEKAPDNLSPGTKIELFEGNKKVAIGEVICSSDFNFKE